MSISKSLILLALLVVTAHAVPGLRYKRAPEPQTEAIDGTTADLGPGDDTPAQFEVEASGEQQEHSDHVEASGETAIVVEESSSSVAPVNVDTTEGTAVLSQKPEVDESQPIEAAATVVSAVDEQPSTTETPSSSSEQPSTSSQAPVSSAASFVSSVFVLFCVYLIAM